MDPAWTSSGRERPPASRQSIPPTTVAKVQRVGPLTGPIVDAARFEKLRASKFEENDSEAEEENKYSYDDGSKVNKTALASAAVQLRNGGDHAGWGNETYRRAEAVESPQQPVHTASNVSYAPPPRQQQLS